MIRNLILQNIIINDKMHHLALKRDWYEQKNMPHIYDAIFSETTFLDLYDVTFRTRIFYIQNDLYSINSCKYCEQNITKLDHYTLKFNPTCGSTECKKKNASSALLMTWKNKTDEQKLTRAKKISSSLTGKKASDETKAKLKLIHTGKTQPPELVAKRFESRKNNGKPWHTNETKAKISATNKTTHNSDDFVSKRPAIYAESYAKISTTLKKRILDGEFTPCITNSWTKWTASVNLLDGSVKKFRSSWECIFWLNNTNLKYESVRIPYTDTNGKGRIYIVDFYDEITRTLYEVKPKSLAKKELNNIKEIAAIQYCANNGFEYKIVDEDWFVSHKDKINFSGNEHLLPIMNKFI